MIYTSYWGNLKNVDPAKVVSVSRYTNFWHGAKCSKLFPSAQLLRDYKLGKITQREYEITYKNYLLTLDVHSAYRALDGKILMCYERVGFCHRHFIAQWFRHFGYSCEEL